MNISQVFAVNLLLICFIKQNKILYTIMIKKRVTKTHPSDCIFFTALETCYNCDIKVNKKLFFLFYHYL